MCNLCLNINISCNEFLCQFLNTLFRSSRPEVFCKKSVLRNLAKFAGKHLCQSLFFNKVAGLRLFSCEFYEISKKIFSHGTPSVVASDRC